MSTKIIRRKTMPDLIVPDEHTEQKNVITWTNYQAGKYPMLSMIYAVPNGLFTKKATAGKAKAEGLKSGVPDLVLPWAAGGYFGLYIEMKKIQGGSVSLIQKAWLQYLNESGYHAVVCKGAEEAKQQLLQYVQLPRTRVVGLELQD